MTDGDRRLRNYLVPNIIGVSVVPYNALRRASIIGDGDTHQIEVYKSSIEGDPKFEMPSICCLMPLLAARAARGGHDICPQCAPHAPWLTPGTLSTVSALAAMYPPRCAEGQVAQCTKGLDGVQNADVCCDAACGTCGGSGCAGRPGGGVS